MRIVIFMLLSVLLTQTAISQDERVPTKKELQEQMLQAKMEAQQQVTELEKEIAEAKKRGDDPESIKELEKQLVTMKKMLGVVDKIGSLDDSKPVIPPVNIYPPVKYISPIIPIYLKQPVVAPTEAQAKDRLLWYKGKKINDTVLVTTKKMVVVYSKKRNIVIVKPDKDPDSTYLSIVRNLAKTEQWKTEFATAMKGAKNSFLMYPEILKAYQEFDLIQERYNKIVKNTIDLPALPGHVQSGFSNPDNIQTGGPLYVFEMNTTQTPTGLEEMYQQLLDLMNNPPALDFPTPPKRPNDLCLCDPDLRKNYETEMSQWSESFLGDEDKLLESAKKIHRYMTDNRNVNVAGMPNLNADLDRALKLAIERIDKKVETLTQRYIGDVLREETVVQAIIYTERLKQKLGVEVANSTAREIARDILSRGDFDKYIDQQMQAKNYNVVFDYSLYLSHEYHKQLFGVNRGSLNTSFFNWKTRLDDFNRFAITIDIDFEFQIKDPDDNPTMIATGKLKSLGSGMIVSLGRLGCKWQFFLTDANYRSENRSDENTFRIPITVKEGEKKILENGVWVIYPYKGPREMLTVFPSVRISFCQNGGKDSAIMDVLRYKDELYNMPNITNVNINAGSYGSNTLEEKDYTVDLLAYANKMLVSIEKGEKNSDQIADLIDEMVSIKPKARAQRPQPTGNSVLDEVQIEYSVNLQQHEMMRKLTGASKVPHTVIEFDAQNSSSVLIDETINTANKEKKILDLTKGLIHLRAVHHPIIR